MISKTSHNQHWHSFYNPLNPNIHLQILHTDLHTFSLWWSGFSTRAGGWRNSPPILRELDAYFSLEITPSKAKIYSCLCSVQTLEFFLQNAGNAL